MLLIPDCAIVGLLYVIFDLGSNGFAVKPCLTGFSAKNLMPFAGHLSKGFLLHNPG